MSLLNVEHGESTRLAITVLVNHARHCQNTHQMSAVDWLGYALALCQTLRGMGEDELLQQSWFAVVSRYHANLLGPVATMMWREH